MKTFKLVVSFLVVGSAGFAQAAEKSFEPGSQHYFAGSRKPAGFFDFLKGKSKDKSGTVLRKCDNCHVPHSEDGVIALETEKSCGKDRLYYQERFKLIPDAYKLKRESFKEAEFPPECIVYAMRTWDAYEEEHNGLSSCEVEDMQPVRKKKLPCVTPEYAYSTYNAYVDVMDCLDIPQRELLPKLWNESFFHVNAYGGGDDAGVGQLTGDAIQEVIKPKFADQAILELEYYKREMQRANKPSCDRILAQESAWKVVSADNALRCQLMRPETSPLRNLLYTGIFYRIITERLAGIYYRAGKEVVRTGQGFAERNEKENTPLGGLVQKLQFKEKMQQLGIENPDMNYLKQVLVTLAFNAGTRTATSIVDDFLKTRIANNMKLDIKELDFVNTDSSAEIALISGPKDETDDAKAERLKKLDAAREVAHQKGLPQFIRLMQVKGSPGYVSKVGYRGTKYNKEIGAGVCTQPSFLQHSSQ